MLDYEIRLMGLCVAYGRRLTADVDDAAVAAQPSPGVNHAAWILGHLAVVADRGLGTLGKPALCPESWGPTFGMGSQPSPDRAVYPTKAELCEAFERGYTQLAEAARAVTAERLAEPNPIERMRERMPTLGDLLAALMTTHLATHLGQLSAWRRQMGLPPA